MDSNRYTDYRAPLRRRFASGLVALVLFWLIAGATYVELVMRDGLADANRLYRITDYWPTK